MKIIIDECVPHIVKKLLPERNIKTVQEMGWDGIKNGELLKLVEADFDLFITSDKNLQHQQNLENLNLSILLLPSNQVPVLEAMISVIDQNIGEIRPNEFIKL
jgi:hypothetical protein